MSKDSPTQYWTRAWARWVFHGTAATVTAGPDGPLTQPRLVVGGSVGAPVVFVPTPPRQQPAPIAGIKAHVAGNPPRRSFSP